MNNPKSIYLMAGGRGSRGSGFDPVMKAVYNEIGKPAPTIAYVGVASGDNWVFYKMITGMMKQGRNGNFTRVAICSNKADLKKARETLQAADAVFMSGGDVEAGMQVLEEKGLLDFFKYIYREGKLYFGASAGAIMLAREWVRWKDPDDDSTAELFPCMDLAPVICDTHAEEDDWEELKAALMLKEDQSSGYGIPTGSCLKVSPDGKLEAIGGLVVHYLRNGNKVEKQSDLEPVK
jgi:peptidase E